MNLIPKLSYLKLYSYTIASNSNDGHCFIWNENVGNRRAMEIGSCILKFTEKYVPIK